MNIRGKYVCDHCTEIHPALDTKHSSSPKISTIPQILLHNVTLSIHIAYTRICLTTKHLNTHFCY